jgi:RNA polymerase-binding transcription factor DksA
MPTNKKKVSKPAKKAAKPAPKKGSAKKAVPAKPAKKASRPAGASSAKAKAVAKPAGKKSTPKKAVPIKKIAEKKAVASSKKHEMKKHEEKPVNRLTEIRKVIKQQEEKKVVKPVVLPKISTTTSRKYEPDFTRSVLDQPSQEYAGPTMRYSDAELTEFRELIMRKLEAAKKELAYLQGLITRKDEMSGDETDNRYMTMEDGSLSMEREQLSQMASRQFDFIDKLEKALMRIENKTYGICRVTGKLIDKARLRAVPHATLSIEAKMGMARNQNIQ